MNQSIDDKLHSVLGDLKDFQHATVSRVIDRYDDPEHSHRVLVADEVGLGKTIVAKGVIARLLLSYLSQQVARPLRVIYICSNLALADENRQEARVIQGR